MHRPRPAAVAGAIPPARRRPRAPRPVSEFDQRRVHHNRVTDRRPDSDLGARCGPDTSSGSGSCAALVAAAAYGGASRDALVVAPGGAQRVEWRDDSVYLTGWAEVVCEGEWLRELPR